MRVLVTPAQRGNILDRNGRVLAGNGTASSVGIVPGKLENRDRAIEQIAGLHCAGEHRKSLVCTVGARESFVPVKTVPKVNELALMNPSPDGELLEEKSAAGAAACDSWCDADRCGGAKLSPGGGGGHLVGYVQGVTAEDLEAHPGRGTPKPASLAEAEWKHCVKKKS